MPPAGIGACVGSVTGRGAACQSDSRQIRQRITFARAPQVHIPPPPDGSLCPHGRRRQVFRARRRLRHLLHRDIEPCRCAARHGISVQPQPRQRRHVTSNVPLDFDVVCLARRQGNAFPPLIGPLEPAPTVLRVAGLRSRISGQHSSKDEAGIAGRFAFGVLIVNAALGAPDRRCY
jgi:hypothetical protein